ncbi:hypothetical protein GA0115254_111683 [Streptomyces sp. Ncost-T10-10d]|nr:hypothetical protein GA0115254_111683 [Streptomyces sp. Ncost-T10-10d]
MDVTKKPGAIQRMKPGHGQPRSVAHIMQDSRRGQQLRVVSQNPSQVGRALRNSL